MGNQNERPVVLLTEQEVTDFIKTSELDEAYVREEFKGFMDDNPSGTMIKADFNQIMKIAYPSVDVSKLRKCVLWLYDTNSLNSSTYLRKKKRTNRHMFWSMKSQQN